MPRFGACGVSTPATVFILLATALALPLASATPNSITDPHVCIRDVECGPSAYCTSARTNLLRGRCTPRLALDQKCQHNSACLVNSTCIFTSPHGRCIPLKTLNDTCNPNHGGECLPGLICIDPTSASCTPAPACDGTDGRCRPLVPGRLGAKCGFDRNCDQDAGFYCRNEPGRCAPKLPTGARCNLAADNFECRGFCATGIGSGNRAICAPSQPLGGVCVDDRNCARPFDLSSLEDRITCNRPRGAAALGRCAKHSQLLRTLGASCDRNRDLCDAIRSLSCRWASHLRRTVCQHQYDRFSDVPSSTYCTTGSKLSHCPGPNQLLPTECRLARAVPGDPFQSFTVNERDVTYCRRARRFVPAGSSCEVESTFCGCGSVCRVVSGVISTQPGRSSRYGTQRAVYCVKVLSKGASCSTADKFRTACAGGLRCVKGKCVTGMSRAPVVKNTHAFHEASCAKLPCTPGFFCGKNNVCQRATARAGFGTLCDEFGRDGPKCKSGLVCRTRWGIDGMSRCQFPQGVGAYCQSNSWCAGKLRCPVRTTLGRTKQEQRCYAPSTALSLGDKCDPKKEIMGPRCSTVQGREWPGLDLHPLRCLPRPKGWFECQIEAMPFGLCDAARRLVCGDRRFECRGGVCLPKKGLK